MKINVIIFAMFLILANGCKPNDPEPPVIEDKGVDLTVKFRPTFEGNNVIWLKEYITGSNDSVAFDKVKFLMSEFTLERNNGELVVLPEAYAFISLREGWDSVILKNVPKGDYKSIRFNVGIASAINHSDPAKWPLDHPLCPSLNDMHWGWSGGYIFNIIEGYYKDKGPIASFSFHIASDKNARLHSFIYDYKIEKNARFVFEVRFDKYFDNVVNFNLKTDGAFSHSGDMDAVMDKFIQNVNGLFDIESFQ